MKRIVVVAPYASVRAGLQTMLGRFLEIVAQAVGSDDLATILAEVAVDAVLLDYLEPDGRLSMSRAFDSGIPIVVLADDGFTLPEEPAVGFGLIRKDASAEEIAGAVAAASSGLIVYQPGLDYAEHGRFSAEASDEGSGSLTQRELEVLQLMAVGLPNKVIAARLGITAHTVKFHVAAILMKLKASSRTEAVTLGIRGGKVAL